MSGVSGTEDAWNQCSARTYECETAATSQQQHVPLHHLQQQPSHFRQIYSPPQMQPVLEQPALYHEPSLASTSSELSYLSHPPLLPEDSGFPSSYDPLQLSHSNMAPVYSSPSTVSQQQPQLPVAVCYHQQEVCHGSTAPVDQTAIFPHQLLPLPQANDPAYLQLNESIIPTERTGVYMWNNPPSADNIPANSVTLHCLPMPAPQLPAQHHLVPRPCTDADLYAIPASTIPGSSRVYHHQTTTQVYDNSSQALSNVWTVPDCTALSYPGNPAVLTMMQSQVMLQPTAGPTLAATYNSNCPIHSHLGNLHCHPTASSLQPYIQSKPPPLPTGWLRAAKPPSTAPKLSAADEEMEIRKMRDFANNFRAERTKLGYTQADVAQQLTIRYAIPVCAGKVSRFESISLSLAEMQQLKMFLEGWLFDIVRAQGVGEEAVKKLARAVSPKKDRKKRVTIDMNMKQLLEIEFAKNSRPSQKGFTELVHRLGVEREVLRTWFCNYRQKVRKKSQTELAEDADNSSPGSPETLETPTNSNGCQDTQT